MEMIPLSDQYRTVRISEELCKEAENWRKGRFESLEALITFALQEIVIPHLASKRETMATRVGLQVIPAAYEIKTYSVKIVLDPVIPEKMDLFTKPVGRTVEIDLQRAKESVVAHAVQKEIKPEAGQRVIVVLMLNDKLAFEEGEMLDLIVRDVETREVLSPAALRLTIARSLKP